MSIFSKEPTVEELLYKQFIDAIGNEIAIMEDPKATAEARTQATYRLQRLAENYNRVRMTNSIDKDRRNNLTKEIVPAAITTVGSLTATAIYLKIEHDGFISGCAAKEIVRNVINTIFKKK